MKHAHTHKCYEKLLVKQILVVTHPKSHGNPSSKTNDGSRITLTGSEPTRYNFLALINIQYFQIRKLQNV